MTFTEHLEELRWCLLKSLVAIICRLPTLLFFFGRDFDFMVAPLRQNLAAGQSLIGTSVTEAFFIEIKVALAAGVFFSCPFIFYQIWRFIAPGLVRRRKEAGLAVCLVRDPVFSRRRLFLLPCRSSGGV